MSECRGGEIVGGHSSLGRRVDHRVYGHGPLRHGRRSRIAGAKAGDVLILTKPIGSGVIMAAEMAGQARGARCRGGLGNDGHGAGEGVRYSSARPTR